MQMHVHCFDSVFYNGLEKGIKDDKITLRLSDAFAVEDKSGDYEWTATMLNINSGHNKELMDSCKILSDYSSFISLIRQYQEDLSFEDAVDEAIANCISQGILKDYLIKMKEEVKSMILTEFDQKGYEEFIKSESFAEGKEEGIKEGIKEGIREGEIRGNTEGRRSSIFILLDHFGDVSETVKNAIYTVTDIETLDKLLVLAAQSNTAEEFEKVATSLIK